ncbi:hypothetical protein K1T35_48320 (plasmid) [Pseudonocardia sp. DSM 110487]|uniref:hypothetical protein n=1 Tax=Pseudonocardia sp. DSM 110487 TaxID=2865833 RepID=UPI001C694DE0|nr:hypothetical protein [Pseudonocardia sp. DSM 110487]QYN41154.1 hypothetical protein K1T35_48320 [Pseudonocardia sp. DSM 110487]
MLTLHDLIQQRFDERGWSYGELERRSDGRLTKSRWQQIGSHNRLNAFPKVATVRLLAEVLDVDETTIVLAAARRWSSTCSRRAPCWHRCCPPERICCPTGCAARS